MKHRNMNQWVEVMVKGSIFFYLFTFLPLNTCAQPKQRRVQQSEQQQRKNPSSAMSRFLSLLLWRCQKRWFGVVTSIAKSI